MPIGDAQAHNFVVGELARRTLGRHLRRMQTEPNPAPPPTDGMRNLTNWWHQKTPWIRAVSNAVPVRTADDAELAQKMDEWKDAEEVYGEKIDDTTRFHHILWGGIGQYVDDPKAANFDPESVKLNHGFDKLYQQPFNTDESARGNKPMPGITSLNVSYKGGIGGGLKKAVVNFTCYSLADLERLEKLYMYPGIKVLVEWGWSKNTKGDNFSHNVAEPIPLDDDILSSVGAVHQAISQGRLDSGGCYDGMFGTVTNFNWTIQPDLSLNCRFDLTDIGDSIFSISTNVPFQNSKVKDTKSKDDTGFTLKKSLDDLKAKLESTAKVQSGDIQTKSVNFKNTIGTIDFTYFRNKFGTPTKQHSDSKDKKGNVFRTYVRFGDIVDQLMNRLYIVTSKSSRDDAANGSTPAAPVISSHSSFSIGGNVADILADIEMVDNGTTDASGEPIEILPSPISVISNHPYLISTDPDICLLPGQLGSAPYDVKTAMSDSKRGGGYVTSRSLPSGLDAKKEHHFNCSADTAAQINGGSTENFEESKKRSGLLANIFVNLDMMIAVATSAASVRDFLNGVTDNLNSACGDIWAFQWTTTDDHPGQMTCLDMNFYWGGGVTVVGLQVANLSGIVKTLNMQSQINNNLASQLYMSNNASYTGNAVSKSPLQLNTALPVAVDFTLDGISGIQFGTTFAIDYLPSKYRTQTYLAAQQVTHTITPGGWNTDVSCMFKYSHPDSALYQISLGNVMDLQGSDTGTDADIACALREEIVPSRDILLESQDETGAKKFPIGIFQSLESVGLTVGAPDGDVKTGKPVKQEGEERETIESLQPRLEDVMSKLYGKGTNSSQEDLDNARALLVKILYLPVDGSAAPPPPPPPKSKSKRKKKKKKVIVYCDKGYEGCTGPPSRFHASHAEEQEETTYGPGGASIFAPKPTTPATPTPTLKLKYRPPGIDIPDPGETPSISQG
mgnify:CR=1 FL=1